MILTSLSSLRVAGIAAAGCLALATAGSAATVSGTVDYSGDFAISFVSSDLTYDNGGAAYAAGKELLLFCLDILTHEPVIGSTQNFTVDADNSVFGGGAGAMGRAAVNWLFDTFYDSHFATASSGQQWAFQYAIWELGGDYDGTVDSISATTGHSKPALDSYNLSGFSNAYQTIYSSLTTSLATLESTYRSERFTIDFFKNSESSIQNLVAFIDQPPAVAPVPLPASLPLVMAGLGLLGFASRKRKAK